MVKLSILTAVYNGKRHIESCLDSISGQECPQVEHIIIDGGSTDGTIDVIRHYASKHNHIRWVSEPDHGQSEALNKAIAMARGEILGILNVDDYYCERVFNKVVLTFSNLPKPSILVGNCNVWDSNGVLSYVNRPRWMRLNDLLLGSVINPYPVNPSAYFYHASIHDLVGPYDENDDYTMDLDFLLRGVQVAHVEYVDEVWGNFLLGDGTKTKQDIIDGNLFTRQNMLMDKYRRQLPRWEQIMIRLARRFYSTRVFFPVAYFSRYPEEAPWRLRKRLVKMAGLPKY